MRRAFLLACLVCTTLNASATPPDEDVLRPSVPSTGQLYIEPHLGLNFTLLSSERVRRIHPGEGELDIFGSAFGIAPLLGVTVGYQFSPTIGAEFDLSYDSRSASNDGVSSDGCTAEGSGNIFLVPARKEYTVGLDYLSLGLVGTFGFESAFFFVGPTASIPLSAKVEETMTWQDDTCAYFFGTADQTISVAGTLVGPEAATHISLRIGAGVRVRIGDRIEFIPRVAYDLGLTDTFTGNGGVVYRKPNAETTAQFGPQPVDQAMQLNALQASLGLRFTL